jgi:hypothetical protein
MIVLKNKSVLHNNIAWNDIQWAKAHKKVLRLQRRIYKAKAKQNNSLVQWLQKRLINSIDAKCVAVAFSTSKLIQTRRHINIWTKKSLRLKSSEGTVVELKSLRPCSDYVYVNVAPEGRSQKGGPQAKTKEGTKNPSLRRISVCFGSGPSLTPKQKTDMIRGLRLNGKASPTGRYAAGCFTLPRRANLAFFLKSLAL